MKTQSVVAKISLKLFDFFASLKLAVIVLISLGVIAGTGTIYEARYDALTAKKIVYESIWMYLVMALLTINLVCSAVERIPWKKKHIPFLLAHVGIIMVIIGAYITQRTGIDGSMAIGIGEKAKLVSLNDSEVSLYQTYTGEYYDRLFSQRVEFLKVSPKDHPISFVIPSSKKEGAAASRRELKVVDFIPYARRETKIVESSRATDGPALRFQLQNPMTSATDWIAAETNGAMATYEFGPARIVLSPPADYKPSGRNEILVIPLAKDPQSFQYKIYASSKPIKVGVLTAGSSLEIPWKMNFTWRIFSYYPHAVSRDEFKAVNYPTPTTTSAVKITFDGADRWVGLNSLVKLFSEDSSFVFTYGNARIPLSFDIQLDRFSVGRYPGSAMAKSYESHVSVEGLGSTVISMNEPLKHDGFTFYQASFQENEKGEPVASVLSVNRDPGRWIKYIGSLLMVSGIIYLFTMRNIQFTKSERARNKSARASTGDKV